MLGIFFVQRNIRRGADNARALADSEAAQVVAAPMTPRGEHALAALALKLTDLELPVSRTEFKLESDVIVQVVKSSPRVTGTLAIKNFYQVLQTS